MYMFILLYVRAVWEHGYICFLGFGAKRGTNEWTGEYTPKTAMTRKAPAMLKRQYESHLGVFIISMVRASRTPVLGSPANAWNNVRRRRENPSTTRHLSILHTYLWFWPPQVWFNQEGSDLELEYVIKQAVRGQNLSRAGLGTWHFHVTILHQVQLGRALDIECLHFHPSENFWII